MRTTSDRIRQAISFEIIGLVLVVPLAVFTFDLTVVDSAGLSLVGSLMATAWNYLFNLAFDHGLMHWRGTTEKTWPLRVVHAISFELGLALAFLPVVMVWLGIGVVESLVMDVAFMLFYIVYAFVFTWGYDTMFPDVQGSR
ncbi:putative membrane protein [Tamilnaduibacter salinus]|uniref:Putative membrane protein n=1 Tax=Tamilnaduibacter salinus TaxID=1484056 RepID=A0A2A2I6G3_9GAMM|nr:PACE efflux transporter [Tamilnaduibacter salinus]PAV27247.1 hypothetical protein CF392_02020 [Tamilnaduibacter salinus]PVY78914.1 putative membrane protein [Tamilnaduibacter salinus]